MVIPPSATTLRHTHRAIGGEGLVGAVSVGDALLLGARGGALAQARHADGDRQRSVYARVGRERCRIARTNVINRTRCVFANI